MKLSSALAFVWFTGVGLLSTQASAVVQPLVFSTETSVPITRWMYAQPGSDLANQKKDSLALLKQAQLQGKALTCLSLAPLAVKSAKALQPWIATIELECVVKNFDQVKNKAAALKVVSEVEAHASWLLKGAQNSRLKTALIQARLLLIEFQFKNDRNQAWDSIEKLIEIKNQLDSKQRALLYRQAGELSFIQQKMDAAKQFMQRSLNETETPEAKERLSSIESSIQAGASVAQTKAIASTDAAKKADGAPATPTKSVNIVNSDLEASAEELNYVKRITVSLKAGDFVTAVEDSSKLIRNYPGGVRAKWATDRILEVYQGLVDHSSGKPDDRYATLTDQVLKLMEKLDSTRLSEWARVAYNRGQYENALRLSKRAIQQMEPTSVNPRAFELAADSALALEKYDDALKYYEVLVGEYGGTASARAALLHIGLINYRKGDFTTTVSSLERLLVLPQIENLEPVARYWLWRALQKTKSDHAQDAADALVDRFPFSYYGLRASIEKNSSTLSLQNLFPAPANGSDRVRGPKIESTLWLTQPERATYERIIVLLQAGCLDEAQAEIQDLPAPITPVDRALRARLYGAALNYSAAINLVNKAWDEQNDLRREPFLSLDFPREFHDEIKTQAQARNLSPYLVMGLIKQESAYQIKAISTSPAYGLMQMIAPTAKEIASDLKIRDLKIPDDLFIPASNIRMGTYYFSKMLARYDGNVAMALAAYNAGPGRFEKWMRNRPSLKDLAKVRDGNPDQELWFDELPWSETSFYVKAILRNYLLYRVIDQPEDQRSQKITFPVWLSPSSQPKAQ